MLITKQRQFHHPRLDTALHNTPFLLSCVVLAYQYLVVKQVITSLQMFLGSCKSSAGLLIRNHHSPASGAQTYQHKD